MPYLEKITGTSRGSVRVRVRGGVRVRVRGLGSRFGLGLRVKG